MKIRIREGNDFDVVWAIKRAGVPEDLSTAINMKLTLVVYGLVIEHNLFTVADNLLSINIPKEVATVNGDYRLIFEYTLPDTGQPDGDLKCKTDVVPFRIVPFTAKADDIYIINVTSDIAFGFKGDKGDDGDDAYQIWLDLGNVGTYEDFIAYLRQPAVDAGASISELEGEIQVNEGLRVQAESERDLSEGARIQSESERLASETIRQSNEGNRIENEVVRVQSEAERISEEGIRQSSEIDRVEAEGIRQSNEIDRIEAEDIRTQAEVERQVTIQEAVTATNLANEKANLANTAAQSANEAAGLADTARTELTTAVNTKLGEADDKIEEMDTTLSTYDGRVTQVESDISQLAGEVNLLDAVHSDKIKDIENVISTMNPNQSAQLSVSGRKTISLPKNAANGGMQVKLEGLTAENLIVNGDFRNGTTGWNGEGYMTLASSNNECTGTISTFGGSNRIERTISNAVLNDKIYLRGDILPKYGNDTQIVMGLVDIWIQPIAGQWNKISRVINYNSTNIFRLYHKTDTNYAIGDTIKFRNLITINLTKTFGAGNEPDSATCDKMFSSYFEGKKNFEPTGRVRSVDKNGLNPTALYLTAPELRSNGTVKDEIRKGMNGYELVKRISDVDGTVLATPVITPISYGGILNSAEDGTVYHEPVIADAGVYGTNMPILLTDYPIASLEEIIKHEGGVDTYLNASTAVIAPDGLSFTHPDLASGDLVLFTYSFAKETTNGNITATFYDSNVVKIDTVTGKAYKITDVVTNGVLTRTLTEV